MKALISGKLEPRELRSGNIFMLCHTLLKKSNLLHTKGLVKATLASTVNAKVELLFNYCIIIAMGDTIAYRASRVLLLWGVQCKKRLT